MKQPAIHYNNALFPERNSFPVCLVPGSTTTTTDVRRVTCKTCLKILGRR